MKRLLMVVAILALVMTSGAVAQDVDTLLRGSSYKDTLTATLDTMDIGFDQAIIRTNAMSIVAYTTTGADTVLAYALAADDVTWIPCLLTTTDLTPTEAVSMIVGTTVKEWYIFGQLSSKYRLVTTDVSASCVFIISGRRVYH